MFGTVVHLCDRQRRYIAVWRAISKPPSISRRTAKRIAFAGRALQGGDHRRIWTEEEVADRQSPPISNPTLCQMLRLIVQHVAALAKRP